MADVLDQAPDPIVIGVDDDYDDTDLSGITLDMIKAVGPGDGCLNQAIYLRDTCLADSLTSVKEVYYENILTFIACITYYNSIEGRIEMRVGYDVNVGDSICISAVGFLRVCFLIRNLLLHDMLFIYLCQPNILNLYVY